MGTELLITTYQDAPSSVLFELAADGETFEVEARSPRVAGQRVNAAPPACIHSPAGPEYGACRRGETWMQVRHYDRDRREVARDVVLFTVSTTATTQDTVEDSGRYDVVANVRRFLASRWFYQGFLAFEGNDELGLDLRSTLGGGFGKYLVQDSRQEWAVVAGLAANRENFATQETTSSLEAIVGAQYSFFRFNDPEANIDASLYVLPSLTESGRVRSEAKLRSRYEIVDDLFFEVSLYGSYDTDADAAAESKSDYGMTTSLGYSF